MIKYKVKLHDFNLHLYEVTLIIPKPLNNQILMMPAWIPGSYVIRDFSKQLSKLTLSQGQQPIDYFQTKSNEWVTNTTSSEPLEVKYFVYAFDKSVRGAYLDVQRGFFNATSLCICPIGFEEEVYELEIVHPNLEWQLVTGLTPANKTKRYEFGSYQAKNYAQLIDCPVMMGPLVIKSFSIQNNLHDIAISGDQHGDLDKLAADVEKICQTQVEFFGGLPKEVQYYCFLLQVSGEGYGGIEHVNSCSLLINKFAIPAISDAPKSKEYISLLGLFSHEYFHLWMVKQIKPAVFLNYDLTQPNYTSQLWAFEGFTAYYDDLMLVRAGLISPPQYFAILAENIGKLFKNPGRKYQSLKDASFDAWTKFYKPDENSLNSTVSYYLKGALFALCCDLQLRLGSNHEKNLDNVMKTLWQKYGQLKLGVEEQEIEKIIGEFNIDGIQDLLIKGLSQTEELPLERVLKNFGLSLSALLNVNTPLLDLGAKLLDYQGQLVAQEVYHEGVFQRLGIQAGDILVACQDHRMTNLNHQMLFQRYINKSVSITVFRDEKLMNLTGLLSPSFVKQYEINAITGFEHNINKWLDLDL